MTKTKKYKDRIFWQSGRGYRLRKVATFGLPSVSDSADPFGVNKNTTTKWPILIAPCALKIQRVTVNALTYPHMDSDGTVQVRLYKTTSGSDTALTAAFEIQGDTDETDQDLTISSNDVDEGDMVYMQVAVSNNTVSTAGAGIGFIVEYRHNEN